ncbi:MAG: glycosyltransferase [Bacteroidaceae bacterium]|nr:glycosyltransferase [Bacteroidaceae bacterium]
MDFYIFASIINNSCSRPMEKTPEISIIVPIYNVEKYLRDCLDSIKSQTFTDWECILIDDCSPDGSGAICDEYAAGDSRFRVIHNHPNGGVAKARNLGIRAVKGEYIGFVDPDDWIETDHFQTLYELITTYRVDMAQVGLIQEYKGYCRQKPLTKTMQILDQKKVVRELFLGSSLPNYLCNKLLLRDIVSPDFPEGHVFEDMYIFNLWARNIHSAVLSPKMSYHYRRRVGSITYSRLVHTVIDYLQTSYERTKILRGIEPDAFSANEANLYLWKAAILSGKRIARYVEDSQDRQQAIEKVIQLTQNFPSPEIKVLGLKRWWRANLIRKYPRCFCALMRFVFLFDFHTRYRVRSLYD